MEIITKLYEYNDHNVDFVQEDPEELQLLLVNEETSTIYTAKKECADRIVEDLALRNYSVVGDLPGLTDPRSIFVDSKYRYFLAKVKN